MHSFPKISDKEAGDGDEEPGAHSLPQQPIFITGIAGKEARW